MENKVNCQIVNILLNDNNEYINKYTFFINGSFDYDNILMDCYKNRGMRSIMIDKLNQSICFTNSKDKVSFYNQVTKKNESYFEEVHIHCNDLYHFDKFIEFLYSSEFSNSIDEVEAIPHYNSINNLKNSELIMEPMTNEVSATRSLVNLLSQRSDETIFRALAIHFGKLVDNVKDIDSNLIHKLNDIYQHNVVENDDIFFSSTISNKLINIYSEENDYSTRMVEPSSKKIDFVDNQYSIILDDEQGYDM